jgi:pteridine reductase
MPAVSAETRVALVTGGAVRVGRAIVEELASGGWAVAFTYRTSAAAARELASRLGEAGRQALAVRADVDDESDRSSAVEAALTSFGRLDALVNNAAIFPRTPLEELSKDQLRAVWCTNAEGPVLLALQCAGHLRETHGSIVNIADIWGLKPLRNHLAYSISKAALIAATRGLALELAPDVRVNAVAPGIAMFPQSYDADTRRRILERSPLRREGGAAEIAGAVRYLLESTPSMTGQVLAFDGGQLIASP